MSERSSAHECVWSSLPMNALKRVEVLTDEYIKRCTDHELEGESGRV